MTFVFYYQIKMDFFSAKHAQFFRRICHCFHCRHPGCQDICQVFFLQELLSVVYQVRRFSFGLIFLLLPVPLYSSILVCIKQRCK